jgi:hypothetical protein
MIYIKPEIHAVSGRRRAFARSRDLLLNGWDRNDAWHMSRMIKFVDSYERLAEILFYRYKKISRFKLSRLQAIKRHFMKKLLLMTTNSVDVFSMVLPPIRRREEKATIDGWRDIAIPTDLRFETKANLREAFELLQFPEFLYSESRHKFSGEEVFLFGIYRLAHSGTYSQEDIYAHFGFDDSPTCSKCFNLFLEFMVENWAYLLTNNMEFWKPYLPDCAEAIRQKCKELG